MSETTDTTATTETTEKPYSEWLKDRETSTTEVEATAAKDKPEAPAPDADGANEEIAAKGPEDTDGESEETDGGKEAAVDKPKKKTGWQRTKEKLEREKQTAEQEREFWRQEALKKTANPDAKVDKPAAAASKDGKPRADDFETHEDYLEAIIDWKADQKLADRDQKAKESQVRGEFEKTIATYNERKDAFKEKHTDFDDVIDDVAEVQVPITVQQIILESENGPELAYNLAKDPAEFKRICALSAVSAARELGKFEASLSKDSPEKTPEAKTTKAPRPVTPVGSKSAASTKTTSKDTERPYSQWLRDRERELKAN